MFVLVSTLPLLVVFNVTISCGREHNSVKEDVLNYVYNLYFFIHRKALAAWSSSSNLVLLGSTTGPSSSYILFPHQAPNRWGVLTPQLRVCPA